MKKTFTVVFMLSALLFAQVAVSESTKPINDADYLLHNEAHIKLGLPCATCHGDGKKEEYTSTIYDSCLTCHGPAEELAQKTAHLGKYDNIHDSAHWGKELACSTCHRAHQPTRNLCVQCHEQDSMTRLNVK